MSHKVSNPWLDVPAADYLAHMSAAEVGQLTVLAELMRDALQTLRPARFMVLGCGTGNGFQYVDAGTTRQVVGLDINPSYLDELDVRFPAPAYERQLVCANLDTDPLPAGPFDLVHVPFVFEFVDWRGLLPRIAPTLQPAGCLTVIVQRASKSVPVRTPTAFDSLHKLDSLFRFVEPPELGALAADCGLFLEAQRDVAVPRQKSFSMLRFRRHSPD